MAAYLPGLAPSLPTVETPDGDSWFTPQWVLDWIGPIALDPCYCTASLVQAAATLDIRRGDDGLSTPWAPAADGVVFVNPPFSATGAWLARCRAESARLRRLVVALVPAMAGDGPWHAHVWPHAIAVGYIAGRVEFVGLNTAPETKGRGHALIVYGPEADAARYIAELDHRAKTHPQAPVWTRRFTPAANSTTQGAA